MKSWSIVTVLLAWAILSGYRDADACNCKCYCNWGCQGTYVHRSDSSKPDKTVNQACGSRIGVSVHGKKNTCGLGWPCGPCKPKSGQTDAGSGYCWGRHKKAGDTACSNLPWADIYGYRLDRVEAVSAAADCSPCK